MKSKIIGATVISIFAISMAIPVLAVERSYSDTSKRVLTNITDDFHMENNYYYASGNKEGSHKIVFNLNSINVNVDGRNIAIDEAPYINGGRTMLPLRAVTETLKAFENSISISWNSANKTVFVTYGSNKIIFKAGSSDYTLNGEVLKMNGGVPEIKNGRVFIPLCVIVESMKLNVEWDSNLKTVTISSDK